MGELCQYGEKRLGQESWSVFTADKGWSLQAPLRGPQGHRDNLGFPKATLKGNKYIPLSTGSDGAVSRDTSIKESQMIIRLHLLRLK